MPRKSTAAEDRNGVAAVDRALSIVCALQVASEPLSLADLARATGLYKSTLLRLLSSLGRYALVIRRPDQRYALGQLAFRLGRAFEGSVRLKESVEPLLQALIDQGTESASFHVWHDDKHRQCLFRIDSKHPTLDSIRPGDLLPLNRGAAGKVLRAFSGDWPARDDYELVYASFGERDPACAAVAAPVFGCNGELLGAISLSGPQERFSEAAVKRMSKLVLAAAKQVTASLGGPWPQAGASVSVRAPRPAGRTPPGRKAATLTN